MSDLLRISVRFLDGTFHGRGDDGGPEWPPSPLRLFQALTNAAARLDGAGIGAQSAAALSWLESLKQTPEILAAKYTETAGYKLYVPDNVADLVAEKWTAGKYFDSKNHPIDIAGYRTEKDVRPLRLSGDAAVHYLWPLDATSAEPELTKQHETLVAIARSITHLGWGVDLVVADAAIEQTGDSDGLRADNATERWLPVETPGGTLLRVPTAGTLADLEVRHTAFLGRLQTTPDGRQFFRPVPPLANFRVVTYRRESDVAQLPYAVFSLRVLDDSRFATFDPQWRRLHLSGMLRCAARQPEFAAALGWEESKVKAFVLGHDDSDPNNSKPTKSAPRLVFIPLPSQEWRGEERGVTIGAIRRVLVTVSGHCEATEFKRIIRALEGRELMDEKTKQPAAFLRRQSDNDNAIKGYFAQSAAWTTVTPVVLPGHDDPRKLRQRLRDTTTPLTAAEKEQIIRKLDARIERLLRKAFIDSGLPAALVGDADLQWRDTGFIPGADLASRYSVPDQCRRFRRLHVRIVWREAAPDGTLQPKMIKGPFCIGSGRFSGLGLFVPA
jgi:CRISPR-associated protein Csb2